MPVTPLNSLSISLANIANLIAASTAWSTWVNAISPDTAADHIHLIGLPKPSAIDAGEDRAGYTPAEFAKLRPFSLVNFATRDAYAIHQIAMNTFEDTGRLLFSFEDAVDPTQDYADAVLTFLNHVGAIIDELRGLCGQDGLPNLQDLKMEKSVTRADKTEIEQRGDYHYCIFSATIGI